MKVTKQHFQAIADVLRELGTTGVRCFDNHDDRRAIAQEFAELFARHNPRFDYSTFITAALPKEDTDA